MGLWIAQLTRTAQIKATCLLIATIVAKYTPQIIGLGMGRGKLQRTVTIGYAAFLIAD